MSEICRVLHEWFNQLRGYSFPFPVEKIPRNGIYVLFEDGEFAHGTNRIVRIGTHTGEDQLRSRLQQHFVKENKDRSIFRKNIGRCLLNQDGDPFLEFWNHDLTTRKAKEKYASQGDPGKQKAVERRVTQRIQQTFTFSAFRVDDKETRLDFEAKIISTVSLCDSCGPSESWFGRFSPKKKIRQSGLWQEQHLYREPLSESELQELKRYLALE